MGHVRGLLTAQRILAAAPTRPAIMGIINVTPDSFSDAGAAFSVSAAVARGVAMERAGAAVLDIGGESTRPGAAGVHADEELRRVIPVIRRLAARVRIPISIDTSKAEVACEALDAGASIVNDVTALGDPTMGPLVAQRGACVILMHMRGLPRTMQRRPRYHDVVRDVADWLRSAVARARAFGIKRERILIDPGIGFGKTLRHNLALLARLDEFRSLRCSIVIGTSRKSFIGRLTGAEVGERLPGTLASVIWAAQRGADMVRVHDVAQVRQCLDVWNAVARMHAARRQH